jgi:hypothetical protein
MSAGLRAQGLLPWGGEVCATNTPLRNNISLRDITSVVERYGLSIAGDMSCVIAEFGRVFVPQCLRTVSL